MLSIEGVAKTYPAPHGIQRLFYRGASRVAVPVLHDVSFSVEPGEVVGLVGPNGAGKTTIIKTICTLLDPDAGRVCVDGFDTTTDRLAVQSRLGVALTDDRALYWRLTGFENLVFFGVMYGLDNAEARERARHAMEQVGLADRDRMTFAYSSGMRTRLAIARALLHDPKLLVLDEVTRSLDPVAAERVGRLLRSRAARGTAVLMSSHRLDEVAAVCDRVVVLLDGRVRFFGTPAELAAGADFAATVVELLHEDSHDTDEEWSL